VIALCKCRGIDRVRAQICPLLATSFSRMYYGLSMGQHASPMVAAMAGAAPSLVYICGAWLPFTVYDAHEPLCVHSNFSL
jgi:hypothetical protein